MNAVNPYDSVGSVWIDSSGYITLYKEATRPNGNVFGTYIHGIFDNQEIIRTIANCLSDMKQLDIDTSSIKSYADVKELEFDKLADILREHMDMELIYKLLGVAND